MVSTENKLNPRSEPGAPESAMIVSRYWFRSSCGVSSAILSAALLAFSGSVLAQEQPPQQPGHPLNPPALPRNSSSSQPVAPGTIPGVANESNIPGISTSAWNAIGPTPLGTGSGADSGRQTGVAVDPTTSNTIYVTAAGGGVWKTTDGGTTWASLTDSQSTLAMGSIAIAPTDHLKIYAGTGEANNSLDSNHGNGILVSSDGGSTWTLETAGGAFAGVTIGQIAVDPTNENTAYAAVGGYGENGNAFANTGIWKTTNGGTSWTNVTAAASLTSTYTWSAVVVDPNTPAIVYAAVGDIFYGGSGPNAVYRSSDGGTTWAQLTNAPGGSSTGRIALAVSPAANTSGHHVLYVAVSSTVTTNSGGLLYFQRSDNADNATASAVTFTDLTSGTPNFLGSQGWYDISLNVDANGVVYAAGVSYGSNILRSTNLGVTWSDITVINNVSPHTDHHAIVFDSSNRMLLGNDGGIWRYDSTVPSWTDLNGDLDTIQFQGIGLHPTSATTIVGGSQDNGTELYTANPDWAETDGGDGGFAQFSQTSPSTCYSVHPVSSYGGADFFQSSTDGCAGTWTAAATGFINTNSNFYPPFIVDPTNGNHLLIGLDRVYETTNAVAGWTAISTPGSNGFNNVNGKTYDVNTVALAPQNGSNPAVIYASTGGNPSGGSLIFVSTDDGALWTARNLPTCTATGHYSAGCRVNQIVTDPNDPTGNTAIAVTSNFTGGGMHVYRTTTAGTSWTDISSGLPDLPTWSAQVDTDPSRTLYVSNDTAVYSSVSPYSTWTAYGSGLPNAQGLDLELNRSLHLLAVGTHGRGAWEIQTPAHVTNVSTSDANGTYGTGAIIPIVVTFSTTVNVTGTPQLTLDTTPGATATYASGTGTTALTFNYTVASGQSTSGNGTGGHLDYTSGAALSLNGGTIIDTSSKLAVLTLYAPAAAGSLSANNSIVISPTGTLITPTVTVTPSSSSITTAKPLPVTVTVSGGNGNPTPTGSVKLSSGSYTSAATTLSAGSASINVPAGQLAVGSDTLTGTYTPDSGSSSTYNGATGTAPVTVVQAIGSCANPNPNPNPNPASFANPGDFNGDCKSDILWSNSSTGQVYEWLMNGTSIASQASPGGATSPWTIVGEGDFNGDGKADILWQNSTTGQLYIWLMNGTAITSQGSPGTVAAPWKIVGMGDFNGDGKSDIVWQNSTTGQLYIWLMNGSSIASQASPGTVASPWNVVGIGDFDGDGKADILWQNGTTGLLYIWLMNGTTVASQASPGTGASPWSVAGVGDFNGDGKSDVLWRNSTTGQLYIWLMNGTASTSQASPGSATTAWSIQGVGDFDGNGDADILWWNSTTGQTYIWLMNGTTVASQASPGSASSPWQIEAQAAITADSAPNLPQNAVSVSDIQTLSSWIAATDVESGSGGGATGTMSLVSSPSYGDGKALQLVTNFAASGDERYSTVFGDDTSATNFIWDVWVYLDQSVSKIANLEMDMNQVLANGQTVIYGFQCDGYSGTWDYTTNTGTPQSPVDEWVHSNAPCNVQNWSTQTWHHVQVQYSRDDSGNVTYRAVWLDGVQSAINATVPSAFALGWGQVLLTNFEVDGFGVSGSSTVYLSDLTVYRW